MIIAGLTCAASGILAAATIRNPPGSSQPGRLRLRGYHCALDGPPLRPAEASSPG